MNGPLLTAELAIYAVLCVPVLYLLVRHSPAGLFGWFYLLAFCTLRMVVGAVPVSSAGTLSSVGLSPLLLAAAGILHEARFYRGRVNRTPERTIIAAFHLLVIVAVGLVGKGASALQSDHHTSKDISLLNAGIGLLTAAWVILCFWAGVSYIPGQNDASAPAHRQGTILLYSVTFSLASFGIRVFYTLVALTTRRPSLSPITGSLAVRVVLSFLPELVATLAFLAAGMWTRNALRIRKEKEKENYSGVTIS
ncbi:hypothetical protein C7999DRAFT_15588 [Corynascus novoguineensis]|uniref:DUF7702 domain-containing protein n=1 Tax=Corynascus novoguineensis TaxID=1126955 RepID=A0AAN7HM48_9PEZI|nr:hypothetical protein C7999DRAFT_15588 [Corynascus novoguineensis]